MIAIDRLILVLLIGAVLAGCDPAGGAWKAAEKENTIEAFQNHLSEFPESKYAAEAKQKIDALAWQQTESLDSEEAYSAYIADYPSGSFAEQANERLRSIKLDGLLSEFEGQLLAFMRDEPSAISSIQGKSWKALDPRVGIESGGFDLIGGRTVIREGSVIVFVDRDEQFHIKCGINEAQYANFAKADSIEDASFVPGVNLRLQWGETLVYSDDGWKYID